MMAEEKTESVSKNRTRKKKKTTAGKAAAKSSTKKTAATKTARNTGSGARSGQRKKSGAKKRNSSANEIAVEQQASAEKSGARKKKVTPPKVEGEDVLATAESPVQEKLNSKENNELSQSTAEEHIPEQSPRGIDVEQVDEEPAIAPQQSESQQEDSSSHKASSSSVPPRPRISVVSRRPEQPKQPSDENQKAKRHSSVDPPSRMRSSFGKTPNDFPEDPDMSQAVTRVFGLVDELPQEEASADDPDSTQAMLADTTYTSMLTVEEEEGHGSLKRKREETRINADSKKTHKKSYRKLITKVQERFDVLGGYVSQFEELSKYPKQWAETITSFFKKLKK